MTATLRTVFLVAALLIVAADGVLLMYAQRFQEDLQTRLAREAVDDARRLLIEQEERRSWREYAPYMVPADALAAQMVLVRSPLAELKQGLRASFSLEAEPAKAKGGAPGLRLRSPWFTDGAGATDPDDPAAELKRKRFVRVKALEPVVRDAIARSSLETAPTVQRDAAYRDVLGAQEDPQTLVVDLGEVNNMNPAAIQKLNNDWMNSQVAVNSYRMQQRSAPQAQAGQPSPQQAAPPQQVASPQQVAAPQQAAAQPEPATAMSNRGGNFLVVERGTYAVRLTLFQAFTFPDPEREGRSATVYARKVEFVSDPGAALPPVGPHYQCFEIDGTRLSTKEGVATWSSIQSTRLLLDGAAALIFALATGGLYLLYAAVASRLDEARRRTEFAAAVSHELKAPLAGIRALAELMHEGMVSTPEKTREYVGNILHESERLSRLIGNVLDAARVERRERTYAVAPGDPAPAVREAVEIFRPHLLGRGFEVAVDVPDALPDVALDRDALVQALANLIDNAAKYTAPCPVRRIAVRARAREGDVAIEVEDTGIGIEPGERARIFEPFRRGRDPLARGTGGAGLGLPIAKSHVAAMGGRIEVEGAKGKGSLFRVVLPQPRGGTS
jgi:two-component system phosphate regulon sensor histidine kinase PhoR